MHFAIHDHKPSNVKEYYAAIFALRLGLYYNFSFLFKKTDKIVFADAYFMFVSVLSEAPFTSVSVSPSLFFLFLFVSPCFPLIICLFLCALVCARVCACAWVNLSISISHVLPFFCFVSFP